PSFRHHEPIELLAPGRDLADGERAPVEVRDRQGMDPGEELLSVRPPRGGGVLLLGIVEAGAPRAGDGGDYAGRPGLSAAVEGGVEGPPAGDLVLVANGLAVGCAVGAEGHREGALVVVDVPAPDDVDSAGLQEVGHYAHPLVAEMGPRRVEGGMVERD